MHVAGNKDSTATCNHPQWLYIVLVLCRSNLTPGAFPRPPWISSGRHSDQAQDSFRAQNLSCNPSPLLCVFFHFFLLLVETIYFLCFVHHLISWGWTSWWMVEFLLDLEPKWCRNESGWCCLPPLYLLWFLKLSCGWLLYQDQEPRTGCIVQTTLSWFGSLTFCANQCLIVFWHIMYIYIHIWFGSDSSSCMHHPHILPIGPTHFWVGWTWLSSFKVRCLCRTGSCPELFDGLRFAGSLAFIPESSIHHWNILKPFGMTPLFNITSCKVTNFCWIFLEL